MSHDYTFISDLNNGGGMPMQNVMQNMPMHYDPNAGMPGQMQMGNPQAPMMGGGMPMPDPNQFDMLRQYLAESADDSDDDSDSDSEDNDFGGSTELGGNMWQHIYGISTLVFLAIIFYYVFKIRKEIVGMYEEV